MLDEEWRPVSGAGGRYEVSSLGRVRGPSGRVLSCTRAGNGYRVVHLYVGGRRLSRTVHSVACEAFHGRAPATGRLAVARHLDGDKLNNRAENLRWGTQSDNFQDSLDHGTAALGPRNGQSKLTEADVREIRRRLADGEGQGSIARRFGITDTNVSAINRRVSWRWLA